VKIALIVPPLCNLNTPYASVPRLAAWLRRLGHQVDVLDLSLELFLRMFSRRGLLRLFAAVDPLRIEGDTDDVWQNRDRYLRVIDDAVAFLQGRDPAFARRAARGDLIPEGPAFRTEPPGQRRRRFGAGGIGDLTRHLTSLMLSDLVELFRQTVSGHLALLSYAEKLTTTAASFDPFAVELAGPPGPIDAMLLEAADELVPDCDLACMTCPFPGMLLGALRLGQWLAAERPRARRALGGGYPSTELRDVSDPRLFDFVDYLCLDDGERPLEAICARLGGDAGAPLVRTFTRQEGRVVYHGEPGAKLRFRELPTPDYDGIALGRYVHLVHDDNPVARLLHEGSWLKLTAAHGCYWKKCTFCDIHLPYIDDFDPLPARQLADQMDELHARTGRSSFHFTDEAAPPPLLVNLALELLRRDRCYQFWGNIRFDAGFTPDRCRLLAAAGMTAVTGGIEIASDALLPRIDKGITVAGAIRVLGAFAAAGILTHSYLIHGFPGETPQDTADSLEVLRQLAAARVLHSAYYHLFTATAHAPVGREPERFGIRLRAPRGGGFGRYALEHEPAPDLRTFQRLQEALRALLAGSRAEVRTIMPELPAPTVPADFVAGILSQQHPSLPAEPRLCWLGGTPRWSRGLLSVACATGDLHTATATREQAEMLARCHPSGWRGEGPPAAAAGMAGDAWLEAFRPRGLVLV
jgi:radical SAM superfamily enzyme YgiQ (UPF0313 family)